MSNGFIVNDADVAGVTTSYNVAQVILLQEDSAADVRSRALPQSCMIGDLELVVDETGATVSQLSGFLTWDSAGNDIMAGEFTASTVSGLTGTSLRMCSVELREFRTAPSGQTTKGKCYLWLKTSAGTCTVKKARLHWSDLR